MSIQFYYVRHGETLFNVIGRAQGSCDSPLTENGIDQARACGERLHDVALTKAFTSSSERAADTAALVLEGHRIEAVPHKGLKEMFFGALEGARLENNPELLRCWNKRDYTAFGGEDEATFVERIRRTFDDIISRCEDGDEVLVVSHRGYFLYMLEALFGQDLDALLADDPDLMAHLIPNASVARFCWADGTWTLQQLPR